MPKNGISPWTLVALVPAFWLLLGGCVTYRQEFVLVNLGTGEKVSCSAASTGA